MSTDDRRACPKCGALDYTTDDVCLTCGAKLTHGPAHEGPPLPVPTRSLWSRIKPASLGACVTALVGGLCLLGAVGAIVLLVWMDANLSSGGPEALPAVALALVLWAVAVVLGLVGLLLLVVSLIVSLVIAIRARRR
jgi:hypothetical protein